MSHARTVAIRGIGELDQCEELFFAVIESGEPEAVAAGMRLLLCHLHSWSHSFMCGCALDRLDAEEFTNLRVDSQACLPETR